MPPDRLRAQGAAGAGTIVRGGKSVGASKGLKAAGGLLVRLALDELSTSAAICSPVQRCRRKASTAAAVAGAVGLGIELGRDERSCKPSNSLGPETLTHLATVFGVMAAQPLVWTGRRSRRAPSSLDLWASKAHPCGYPFGSPRITEVWRHQRSRSGPNIACPSAQEPPVRISRSGWPGQRQSRSRRGGSGES